MHRVRVRAIGLLSIFRPAGVAGGERIDVGALTRCSVGFQADGFLHQLEGLRLVRGIHGRIDVRAEDERLSPIRHRARGIQPRRFRERATGFGMVESVREIHSLIDEELRFRALRFDLEGVDAKILQTRRQRHPRRGRLGVAVRFFVMFVLRRRRLCRGVSRAEQQQHDCGMGGFHRYLRRGQL